MKREPSAVLPLAIIAALILALPGAAMATGIVGQLQSDSASLNNAMVPSGTAVPVGVRLGAHKQPVVVHLTGGQVLRLAANSQVQFLPGGPGEFDLRVDSGTVYLLDEGGELMALGAGGGAAFFIDEPPIGEGTAVGTDVDPDEETALCHLRNPTPERVQLCTVDDPDDDDCRWQRITVENTELAMHLGHGDVYRDKDRRTPGMDEDLECRRLIFWLPVPQAVATAAGTVLVLSELTENDGPPASPVNPQ